MALRFCDSFDHYDDSQLADKYHLTVSGPLIASNGRFSQNFEFADLDTATRILDAQATWIVGFAVYIPTTTNVAANSQLISIMDGSTLHVDLRWSPSNNIVLTRNGTGLGSASPGLSRDNWYFVELKVTIGDAGSYEVRLNGTTFTSSGSADTRNGGNPWADRIRIGNSIGGSLGAGARLDDLYVCDDTGGVNDDFLGDVRVQAILPNGNGNSSQFDGSDGNTTDNYLLVDDAATSVDSDTTYVQSPDVGDKDTYTFGNVTPSLGSVYGVQILPFARKTDAGTRSICSVARLSGTETDSADKVLLTSYDYHPDIREEKPGGGSWSISDVNNAEFGQKVTA